MGIKRRKTLQKLGGVGQIFLILLLVALAVFSFATKLPLFSRLGLNFFAVTSGSMEPTLPVGSLIYTGRYRLADLKKGDVITFRVKDSKRGTVSVVTHRIEKVLKEEKAEKISGTEKEKKIVKYNFATKGDANNTTDPRLVPAGNIIGLYRWNLPKVGYITSFAQTQKGFLLLIILPAVILIIWEFISLANYMKIYYREKAKKEIKKDK